MSGSLVVAGFGIGLAGQVTADALAAVRRADEVLYVLPNVPAETWVRRQNRHCTSLSDTYDATRPRQASYALMADRIVSRVRAGRQVCALFYGHPGILAQASHLAIRRVRRLGLPARMLPGISADGCLFADLGINPGDRGCQQFEATDFLAHRRRIDPTSYLILWQVGVIGEPLARGDRAARPERVRALAARLRRHFPPSHRVAIYVASTLPPVAPYVRWVRLDRLASVRIIPSMTLFVPPLPDRRVDGTVARWMGQR